MGTIPKTSIPRVQNKVNQPNHFRLVLASLRLKPQCRSEPLLQSHMSPMVARSWPR